MLNRITPTASNRGKDKQKETQTSSDREGVHAFLTIMSSDAKLSYATSTSPWDPGSPVTLKGMWQTTLGLTSTVTVLYSR